jgi:alpha-L-rhamnosidase
MKSILILTALASVGAVVFAGTPLLPVQLKCEYRINPLGIDVVAPQLSWILESTQRGQRQRAYQVLVASSASLLKKNKGDLWDSGKVESNESSHVIYVGESLQSRMDCYWKVRVWDKGGKQSDWSQPAMWSMGLLQASDWNAKWISYPLTAQEIEQPTLEKWLWHPTEKSENCTIFFRRQLNIDKSLSHIMLELSVDNSYYLLINGKEIAQDANFKNIDIYRLELGGHLRLGSNVIAVRASNADGPCGFICGIRMHFKEGRSKLLPVEGWQCSDKEQKGWANVDFQPEGWSKPTVIADYGSEPWGKLKQAQETARRSLLVRKGFILPDRVIRARAFVCGLGMYEMSANGQRVGSDVFTPGWTLYQKRIQYQTYDVTKLLRKGQNAIGAILGNGWWSGGLGWGGNFCFAKESQNLRFLLQLDIECADGSHHQVVTDGGWGIHTSPIVYDTLYHGEKYDSRLELSGWNTADFDDSDWERAQIVEEKLDRMCAQQGPTLRVTQELKAVSITEHKPGVHIIDFGQNHSGYCRLTCKAPAGTIINIRHAEILQPDGSLYTENYRSARVTDTYICKGGDTEVWEPRFTYRGFRYAEITGLPGKPDKNTLVSQVMHTAPEVVGRFECSNPLLNRIWQNVLWGQRSNLHSVPTDCPQRDERLGWMGDAQVFAPVSCWNMDMAGFYRKWLRDIVDSQKDSGATTNVCPVIVVNDDAKPGWGDAINVIPLVHYLYYGDKRMLEENYEPMKRWVEYMRTKSKGNLYETGGYGDWVPVVKSPAEPIGSAYYYHSTNLLVQAAQILGKSDDVKEYSNLAKSIAAAFNAKHFDLESNSYTASTQTANLLPLSFGITPPEHRQAVADNIAEDVRKRSYHHSTGFLGTVHVLPILTQYGYHQAAWRVASTDAYPSLGYMVKCGATTVWERWDSDKQGPGMNSRNHFAFGCLVQWYMEKLAGINPDPKYPGFERVIIRPRPVGELTWARGSYNSQRGMIISHWQIAEGQFHLQLTIPANVIAMLYLPTNDEDSVHEGGKSIDKVQGVEYLGAEEGTVIYRVESGDYDFIAPYTP